MRRCSLRAPLLLAACLGVMACGGSQTADTGPLKTTLSERYIAGIPIREQQAVIHSEEELALARRKSTRARVEYEQSATSLEVARYEQKRAEYAKAAALAKLRSAQSRAQLQDLQVARVDVDLATADQQAAAAKLSEAQASRAYLKAELDYRLSNERAKEARYELEKARLATAHQIEPKGFSLAKYEQQFHNRMAQAKSAQLRARDKRVAASAAHDRWVALKNGAHEVHEKNGAPPFAPVDGSPPEPADEPADESPENLTPE